MLNKFTIIGLIGGIIISGLGGYALVDNLSHPLTLQSTHDMIGIGDSEDFTFNAPVDANQSILFDGDVYHIIIESPGDTFEIDDYYKGKQEISWTVKQDGDHYLKIENTGKTELEVTGSFEKSKDPLLITHNLLVLVAGIIIAGFSAVFSLRKPRGF